MQEPSVCTKELFNLHDSCNTGNSQSRLIDSGAYKCKFNLSFQLVGVLPATCGLYVLLCIQACGSLGQQCIQIAVVVSFYFILCMLHH